jgi:peptidoglycan/xylan/chitin deacetylase (PgdA/CDA1 family)
MSGSYTVDRAHGIMFHHFHDDAQGHPKGQGAISAAGFEDIIRRVGPSRILPAKEWVGMAGAGTLPADALCLTFDDALKCQLDVALPVMRDYGLTALWFVPSAVCEGGGAYLEVFRYFRTVEFGSVEDFYIAFYEQMRATELSSKLEAGLRGVDVTRHLAEFAFYTDEDRRFRYVRDRILTVPEYERIMLEMIASRHLSPEQLSRNLWLSNSDVRALDAHGHVIGLHSYSHPTDLRSLPVEQQTAEYQRNYAHLSSVLGKKVETVAHPCNSYSEDTLSILRQLGVVLGFCSRMVEPGLSALEWPRQDHTNITAASAST